MSKNIENITDAEIMVGSIIFILLSSIDPKYQGGKRGRKAILKDTKKVLLTYGYGKHKEKYLKLVQSGNDCMHRARESMVAEIGDKGYYINPGSLLQIISKRYPEYIEIFNLKESHINDLYNHYKEAGIGFASMKFGNRLISEVNSTLGIELPKEPIKY